MCITKYLDHDFNTAQFINSLSYLPPHIKESLAQECGEWSEGILMHLITSYGNHCIEIAKAAGTYRMNYWELLPTDLCRLFADRYEIHAAMLSYCLINPFHKITNIIYIINYYDGNQSIRISDITSNAFSELLDLVIDLINNISNKTNYFVTPIYNLYPYLIPCNLLEHDEWRLKEELLSGCIRAKNFNLYNNIESRLDVENFNRGEGGIGVLTELCCIATADNCWELFARFRSKKYIDWGHFLEQVILYSDELVTARVFYGMLNYKDERVHMPYRKHVVEVMDGFQSTNDDPRWDMIKMVNVISASIEVYYDVLPEIHKLVDDGLIIRVSDNDVKAACDLLDIKVITEVFSIAKKLGHGRYCWSCLTTIIESGNVELVEIILPRFVLTHHTCVVYDSLKKNPLPKMIEVIARFVINNRHYGTSYVMINRELGNLIVKYLSVDTCFDILICANSIAAGLEMFYKTGKIDYIRRAIRNRLIHTNSKSLIFALEAYCPGTETGDLVAVIAANYSADEIIRMTTECDLDIITCGGYSTDNIIRGLYDLNPNIISCWETKLVNHPTWYIINMIKEKIATYKDK